MAIEILALRLDSAPEESHQVSFLDQPIVIRRSAVADIGAVGVAIRAYDGKVDAIALEGMSRQLQLGRRREEHAAVAPLFSLAQQTPMVDGSGVRGALERWAVRLVSEQAPGTFIGKHVLMVPGLNHGALKQAIAVYTDQVHYADNVIYFALSGAIGSDAGLARYAGPALRQMRDAPPERLWPTAGKVGQKRADAPFRWADVLAGDAGAIRRYAPTDLAGRTVVIEAASYEDVIALRERGVELLITTMPPLAPAGAARPEPGQPARFGAAIIEAIFAALREDPEAPLNEATYLNLLADLAWQPALLHLQGEIEQGNRFAYVIHPLSVDSIYRHPAFRFTRALPDGLVERAAAQTPPLYLSRLRGAQSPTTGQKVEGILVSLGATPAELMRRDAGFAYRRLLKAAQMAERTGARLMGLSAFTSVLADAGIAVANKVDIGITSGHSLTVAVTLEAAKRAVQLMGTEDLAQGTAMVVGATDAIGSVCSRLLARDAFSVILVDPRPEKLIALKRQMEEETPGAKVLLVTGFDDFLSQADLIVTAAATSDSRGLDITRCKPGAVICDMARPPVVPEEESARRPDVLVVESGEVRLPGEVSFGYDIGLPPGVVYPCLAEAALLAMEGRFDDFTLGRQVEMAQVTEIYELFQKHRFELAGLRSHGRFITDDDLARRRALADEMRAHPERIEQIRQAQQVAAETGELADANPMANLWPAGLAGLGVATAILGWWSRRKSEDEEE